MRMRGRRVVRMSTSALSWAYDLWASINCPRSLTCVILARYKEWSQLVNLQVSPHEFQNSFDFYRAYQSTKLLSKFPYLDTGINRKSVAKQKFIDAEIQCIETNTRLSNARSGVNPFPQAVNEVIFLASKKIASILGHVPCLDDIDFRFGPGASFGVRGDTSVYKKLTSPLECTFAFARILSEFLGEFPGWIRSESQQVNLVAGSELTFVPKDAKTDRPICIEPLLNGLYQKGFGSLIRDRLNRWGVNLRDQSVNQRLARLGCDGSLTTVDFQSASDTIAYDLVQDLLPLPWVEALGVARCSQYLTEDGWFTFNKWSSMGNAYTFELESLIFYALAIASCEVSSVPYETGSNLSVYGDDVIIPTGAFPLFLEVTKHCGFTVNTSKSFHSGVFRESCGADWFLGFDVRPYQLKKRISSYQDLYYATNSTLRVAAKLHQLWNTHEWRLSGNHCRFDTIRDVLRVHAKLVGSVPFKYRVTVPDGVGETGFIADFDVACPKRDAMFDGYWVRSFVPEPTVTSRDSWPASYPLYWAGSGSGAGWWDIPDRCDKSTGYSLRGSNGRYRLRKQFIHFHWPSLPIRWLDQAVAKVKRSSRQAP